MATRRIVWVSWTLCASYTVRASELTTIYPLSIRYILCGNTSSPIEKVNSNQVTRFNRIVLLGDSVSDKRFMNVLPELSGDYHGSLDASRSDALTDHIDLVFVAVRDVAEECLARSEVARE